MSPERKLDYVRRHPNQKAAERRLARWNRQATIHLNWPYCGDRHRERIARQIRDGKITVSNGLVP